MKKNIAKLAFACSFIVGTSQAFAAYPERPVNVVMGFPAGQSVDVAARLVMEPIGQKLQTPFVMVNKPGAGGIIGTDYVAKADPDGYTLLFGSSSSLVINAELYKSLPYNTLRDFNPVSLVAEAPMFLVINKDLPVNSLAEFVDYAKKRPGELNYASAGNGLTNHLVMEMFKKEAGLNLVHVPYKGSSPGLADVVGGRVHAMFDAGPGALPLYKQGLVRILAVSSAERSRAAPEIATLREQGVDMAAVGWVGLMAPKNTDPKVISALSSEVEFALKHAGISDKLVQLGFEPKYQGPTDFLATIESELPIWGRAVKESGATVD